MELKEFFTEDERIRVETMQQKLFALAADVIQEGDQEKVKS